MNIIKYYKVFFAISIVLVIASIASLAMYGLNLGIDFRGGTLIEMRFPTTIDTNKLSADLTAAGFGNVSTQPASDNRVIIKMQSIESQQQREQIVKLVSEKYGQFEEQKFDTFGPTIGKELQSKAIWQTGLVMLGILLYIAYAFRKVSQVKSGQKSSSWKMSWAAIIALVHDLLIVLGVFAVLGKFWHVEIDSLFITALLTVLGFSVHDTIVVFDRVRENLQRGTGMNFIDTLNYSVNQTLTRSINTSMTVLLVLLALALFGGASTFYFIVALLVGIAVGTYSSIYIASTLLLVWHK